MMLFKSLTMMLALGSNMQIAVATADKLTIGEVILRMEPLLPLTPGGAAQNVVSCNLQRFVDSCVTAGVEGVSIELKRGDVSRQKGHLYFESAYSSTSVYTEKGYQEEYLFALLKMLRKEGIKTYAWWPTFNDPVFAQANPSHAMHTRNFGSGARVTSTQFVSPHSSLVRDHELALIDEILTHPKMTGWDGVRLDYIRYNHDEDDFSDPALADYQTKHGLDAMTTVTSAFDEPWNTFRRDTITSFLLEATTQIHSYDPDLDVGGYLLPFAASSGGWGVFQGQGNDFTQYHSFGFRALPMVYWQETDWVGSSGNFENWTKERIRSAVNYTTDAPGVWPVFSITGTGWCGSDESCHRQHLVDALLIASNSGKVSTVSYQERKISIFYYGEWSKPMWDRLDSAMKEANAVINGSPTPSPSFSGCRHFVPCGYSFYPGQNSGYQWGPYHNEIPDIQQDCDADAGCIAFDSRGLLKWQLDNPLLQDFSDDPTCSGLYVYDPTSVTPSPTSAPTLAPAPMTGSTSAPTSAPTATPTSKSTREPTASPTSEPTTSGPSCPYAVPIGYTFHPFVDSPGYSWGPFNWRNIDLITRDCDADTGCRGFNSNGWLKSLIKGQGEWTTWTTDPCLGLYVKN